MPHQIKTANMQCGIQLMSLKHDSICYEPQWVSTGKIHNHSKQAASHRCCRQMTVAGHHHTCQEKSLATALHLIECTLAFRQLAREFSSSPGKQQRVTWRDNAAKRAKNNNFLTKSAPSCNTLLMRIGASVRFLWVHTDSRCPSAWLLYPQIHFKQIVFSGMVPKQMTVSHDKFQPFMFHCWQRNHSDVQQQLHQKLFWTGEIWLPSGMAKMTGKPTRRIPWPGALLVSWTDCRWCQGLTTERLQSLDKLASLILLVFDLETDVGSFHIMRGHRLWGNVFSIQPRSIRPC